KGSNRMAADFAMRFGKPAIGGSDAHTLASAGRTFTDVRGAAGIEDYLAGLRRGNCIPSGESGDFMRLNTAVFHIGGSLMREKPWMLSFGWLFAAIPAAVLVNYVKELAFAWRWKDRTAAELPV